MVEPNNLRSLVQDCVAKHLYSTAVFYADKLVTLSDYAPGDVYLLAQVGLQLELAIIKRHALGPCLWKQLSPALLQTGTQPDMAHCLHVLCRRTSSAGSTGEEPCC
jgi:hypothetical protein